MAALALKMKVEKYQIQRMIRRLEEEKRVEKFSNRYRLTKKGEKEIGEGNEPGGHLRLVKKDDDE